MTSERPIPVSVRTEWLWFGLLLAVVHLAFVVLIVLLLQRSLFLGIAVAVAGGVVGTTVVYAYVLRRRGRETR